MHTLTRRDLMRLAVALPSAGLFADIVIVTVSPTMYADLSVETVTASGGPTWTTVSVPDAEPVSGFGAPGGLGRGPSVAFVAVTVNGYTPGQ